MFICLPSFYGNKPSNLTVGCKNTREKRGSDLISGFENNSIRGAIPYTTFLFDPPAERDSLPALIAKSIVRANCLAPMKGQVSAIFFHGGPLAHSQDLASSYSSFSPTFPLEFPSASGEFFASRKARDSLATERGPIQGLFLLLSSCESS